MSVADQSLPAASLPTRVPSYVRLSPQFVNRLCTRIQKTRIGQPEMAGLLFGVAGDTRVIVQAFKSFAREESDSDRLEGQRLRECLERSVAAAQNDPEVSALDLLGWYWLRETGGLHENDLDFHNEHFPKQNDLAVILSRESGNKTAIEIYTRANDPLLSAGHHRWGALRLETDVPVSGSVEIALQGTAEELVQELESAIIESAPVPGEHKSKLRFRKRIPLSILNTKPRRKQKEKPEINSAVGPALAHVTGVPREINVVRAQHSIVRDRRRTRVSGSGVRISAGVAPSVPALRVQPRKTHRMPWIASAALCAIAAGATFAFLLLRGLPNGSTPLFLRGFLPNTELQLRAEGQGDRLLLSWNRRNSVVRDAADGILHIDDGAQHRDVRLDSGQIENGLVLYRPGSNDITFRLEVHGVRGGSVGETVRVLDGPQSKPLEVSAPEAPPTPRAVASSSHARQRDDRVLSDTRTSAVSVTVLHKTVPARPAQEAAAVPAARPALEHSEAPGNPSPSSAGPPSSAAVSSNAGPATGSPPVPAEGNVSTTKPAQAPPGAATPNGKSAASSSSNPAPSQTSSPAALADAALPHRSEPAPANPSQPSSTRQTAAISPPAAQTGNSNSAAPAKAPGPTSAGAPQTSALGAAFVPARPIREVLPDSRIVSESALQTNPQIELTVLVDKEGRVRSARVVNKGKNISQNLIGAAIAAAKQWTFQPATLHGRSIATDHTIVFQFSHQ